jgi:esterase/lipase superfamily enzyme
VPTMRQVFFSLVLVLVAVTGGACTRFVPNASSAVVLVASNRRNLVVNRPLDLLLGVGRGSGLTFRRCRLDLPDVQRPDGQHRGLLLGAGRDHIKLEAESDMPEPAFAESLAHGPTTQPSPAGTQEVLIYVHGYAASPRDAVIEAGQFAHDVHFDQPVVVFTWPTREFYLSYLVDGINAEWSVPDFVHLLELVHGLPGAPRVHVIGHSMGARIVMRGIKEFLARRCVPPSDDADAVPELPAPRDGKWFGQVILVAPDEDTEVFERSFAPILARITERTTIYFSTRDRALGLAYTIFGYKRLGMGDCPELSPAMLERIQSIDVTRVDRGFFGHFYHIDSPEVLADIRRVLADESAMDARRCLRRNWYYQLRPSATCSGP